MSLSATLTLFYDDYASFDDTVSHQITVTERQAQIALSVLYLLDERGVWEATDSEFDSIAATLANLASELESV